MSIVIIGLMLGLNMVIITVKYRSGSYSNATVDLAMLVLFAVVLGGSTALIGQGIIASSIVSLYLYWRPIDMSKLLEDDDDESVSEECAS